MPKFDTLQEYLLTLNQDAIKMYETLKKLIMSLDDRIQERLFAGQVAFYNESTLKHSFHASPVIIMAFQKDHVNIFAQAIETYQAKLSMYQLTKKFTLQLAYKDSIHEILNTVFLESLT